MCAQPYAAFILDHESQEKLTRAFPPKFSEVRANHITIAHDTIDPSVLFTPKSIKVVGYASNNQGIEAVLIEVDGQQFKSDGNPWHITISFDKDKEVPGYLQAKSGSRPQPYKGFFSNQLLRLAVNSERPEVELKPVEDGFYISAEPKIVLGRQDLPKTREIRPTI